MSSTAVNQNENTPPRREPGSPAGRAEIAEIYHQPLLKLITRAAGIHQEYHPEGQIQKSKLLSIKTGACPEDCGYCSQSARHNTSLEKEKLMDTNQVVSAARQAREEGADRFCMGAAWRQVRDGEDFDRVLDMVSQVKELGLETCVTLGMVNAEQAARLKEAGLDYYNHNIDTSPEHYNQVITTRTFDDRLDTIRNVQSAGMKVCCGGILGLGESDDDRISMIEQLVGMDPPPESIPINNLVPVEGTPLGDSQPVDVFTMVRTIATIRVLIPASDIRLSAGRRELSQEGQALCFLAGANSIFAGDKLLTTPNADGNSDGQLLSALGLS